MSAVLTVVVQEGKAQYRWDGNDVRGALRRAMRQMQVAAARIRQILLQPVRLPGRMNTKEQTRLQLFTGDIFRFGFTFAAIFGALFFSLNYQSFWSIVAAEIDPLSSAQEAGKLSRTLETGDAGTLFHRPDSLLAMLPTVGPPENRLIIPKLTLNVPIVIPPNDALLEENWSKLEEEIQAGLQDGVVHYPGTARPGQAGNFFVTGHSSYYPWADGKFKSVFARLTELSVGDEYWVYYGGDKHRYRIAETKEVSPADVSVLDQPTSKRIATLMTCTPVGTTLRRLIVRAEEIDPVTGNPLDVGESTTRPDVPDLRLEMLPI